MSIRQYLKDYRPPDYLIDTVDLRFEIGADGQPTRVTSRLKVRRSRGVNANTMMRLDGRELQLLAVKLDGQELDPEAYQQDAESLTIKSLPARFELEIQTAIDPWQNSSLEGWYAAGEMLCTQCESHGFSRITYFPDRPDVMAIYRTTLVADPGRFPVLLANGNRTARRKLADGRLAVSWHDPHPKPSYLFAAVAGDLARRRGWYTSLGGRRIRLEFYSDHGIEDRVEHAMESLRRAMRWDEESYGREYDLDLYMVVVAAAFNMGAMENKGLNIFNPRFVLASPETATDADYIAVNAVVGHEYFHNWSGNRVTCRDWFQLSLKEGLTVFREQQFAAATGAGPVQRIEEVRLLRGRQFAEDGGPLAHAVRPDSYVEMNNFYTITVYEKGAELVRVLQQQLGARRFRKGMDRYFRRHDGQAVTIEDFLKAHADASGVDTRPMLAWYGQAGTPQLTLKARQTRAGYELRASQKTPPTPGQVRKTPVPIPIRISLLDAAGDPLPLDAQGSTEQVLQLNQAKGQWAFPGLEPAAPVLLQGFSAPVKLDFQYSRAQLELILRAAADPYARWDAAQRIFLLEIDAHQRPPPEIDGLDCFAEIATGETDPAVLAELLTPPRADELSDRYAELDFDALQSRLDAVELALARVCAPVAAHRWSRFPKQAYRFEPAAVGQRRLRARLLQLWVASGDPAAQKAAQQLYDQADNLSDRLAALTAMNRVSGPARERLFKKFYGAYRQEALVLDRWFALQASLPGAATVDRVEDLLRHPAFEPANPNRVRAVLGSFGMLNPSALFSADGRGVALLAKQVARFDRSNPQLASRLITPFALWRRLAPPLRHLLETELKQLRAVARSPDVREQLERMLKS